tara:strand:+ start:1236 stop:3086 length:1851 start_codon:yes stop_codon:yes gene_type:complete
MSLLRNSILAAAGTTVAGLGLMELTSSKPFSLPKPSWYLQASILTGVAGGIGYFLVNNKYTPEEIKMDAEDYYWTDEDDGDGDFTSEHESGWAVVMLDGKISIENPYNVVMEEGFSSMEEAKNAVEKMLDNYPYTHKAESPTDDELESWSERQDDGSMLVMIDEDGDSHTELTYDEDGELTHMKRFAAEVFEADRKLRRRTRWTWARGFEPQYAGHETRDEYETAVGYDIDDDYYNNRTWSYEKVYPYDEKHTYHISDLPEGYHLHLWKPRRRSQKWKALGKSPNQDRWEEWIHDSKGGFTADLLEWYNQDIAKPEVKALSPMQKFVIAKGGKSGKVQIHRVEHPKVEKEIEDKETGTISYKTITPHIIEYFASGGPDRLEPRKVAEIRDGWTWNITSLDEDDAYYHVQPFLQGLSFLGWEKSGDNRSVNRFNKDASTWPNVYPAWFKNAVKQKMNKVDIDVKNRANRDVSSHSEAYAININDISMIRFLKGGHHHEYRFRNNYTMYHGMEGKVPSAPLQVYDTTQYEFEIWDGEKWYRPRKSTQTKLYEGAMYENLNGEWTLNLADFITVVCEKYQFERQGRVKNSMQASWLLDNASTSIYKDAVHLMLRRVKKN